MDGTTPAGTVDQGPVACWYQATGSPHPTGGCAAPRLVGASFKRQHPKRARQPVQEPNETQGHQPSGWLTPSSLPDMGDAGPHPGPLTELSTGVALDQVEVRQRGAESGPQRIPLMVSGLIR